MFMLPSHIRSGRRGRLWLGAATAVLLAAAGPVQAAPFAYVTNLDGASISQYELGVGGSLSPLVPPRVATRDFPGGVAVSPDGESAYVTNAKRGFSYNTVRQYDVGPDGALTPKSPPTVVAGDGPIGVAVSPDGESVYATNQDSDNVSQYDVGQGGALQPKSPPTVAAGDGPGGVAVSPDGESVYVTNLGFDHSVSQYDVGPGGTLTPKSPPTVAAGSQPFGVAVSPDGGSVYVTNLFSNNVSQYDVGQAGALRAKSPATVATGDDPFGVAVSPDGESVYVTNVFSDNVSQYDVGPGGVLRAKSPPTVAAELGPNGVALSPDGDSLYVANRFSDSVSQYDVGAGGALTAKSASTVAAGDFPFGLAVSPAECSDTRDNDGDGDADFPADASCTSTTDSDEASFVFGRGSPGGSFRAISRNVKRASRFFLLYGPATVTTLRAYLDGNGGPTGAQSVRAVIYTNTASGPGALLAQSAEKSIAAGRAAGFVDFVLPTPVSLGGGYYWLGLHSGEDHGIARFGFNERPNSRIYNIDNYTDGASNPFVGGRTFSDNLEIAIHAIGYRGATSPTN